ncbi:MAG: hypothetical protein ACOX9C_08955 [Kiritimatiellia bacterium]|jgi:hypothetical protein
MKSASVIALLAAVVLAAGNVVLGPLNQDEGWYLLAGLNTASGLMPYRDFLFTQGPAMPLIYAAASPLWGPFGVLGGRVFTASLGLVAAAFCAGAAWRLASERARPFAALVAWLLVAACPVFSYFTAIPKTYALSGLCIAAAFFTLSGARSWRFECAGALLAVAAGTRLSLGILLAVVGFGLLFLHRRPGLRRGWFRFGIGGGLVLVALYGAFAALSLDGLLFSQTYHASRTDAPFFQWLLLRAGSLSRLLQGYFPIVVAAGVALVARAGRRSESRLNSVVWLALAGFLAATLVHGLAPFPYDDYQTPVMPLAAVVVAVSLADVLAESGLRHDVMAWAMVVTAGLFMVSSPLCMDWVTIRKDRFWMEMKETPDLFKLREVGAWLRENTAPGDVLLTQDAYLAVEARRKVLPGLEMGPFSLFPDLDDETARRRRVHNVATLATAIAETDAPVAALSGYAFAVSCPTTERLAPELARTLADAVRAHYEPVKTVADFGQGHTTLELHRRRAPETDAAN